MANQYLYTVPFKELLLWDVKRYKKLEFTSHYPIDYLGNHINSETEKIDLSNYPEQDFDILGITNDRGMIDAYTAKGKTFNQPYKIVKDGFIAYNPYRVNVGSIGIKTNKTKGNLISPAYVVFSCKSTLLPEFLFVLMKTKQFHNQIKENTSGSVRQNLIFDSLSRIKIPVPSIDEQQKILDEFKRRIEYAESLKPSFSWLLVEKQMNDFLQLTTVKNEIEGDFLATIKYSLLLTWDVKNRQGHELFETDKYDSVMLNNLVEINPKLSKQLKDDDTVSFVPMECVSDFDGSVKEYRECKYSTKGFTKFEDGDIIWAKITPCMQNGKSAIVNGMKNGVGYGSTEFYVLRRKSDKVLTEYLYYILRSIKVRTEAVNYFSGSAGQQRVRKSFLQELRIPLPSLQEQKELVALLDEKKKEMNYRQAEYQVVKQQAKENFENAIFN